MESHIKIAADSLYVNRVESQLMAFQRQEGLNQRVFIDPEQKQ